MTDMVMMPGADYQAICDAIRSKTGSTELLKSGDLATLIGNLSDGEEPIQVPSLSGRKVASGSISVAADTSSLGTISHDVESPIAVFLFAADAPLKNEGGTYIKQTVAKLWIRPNPMSDDNSTMSCTMVRGMYENNYMHWGNPGTLGAYGFNVNVEKRNFTPGSSSNFPFVAGTTYYWIVIGEEV